MINAREQARALGQEDPRVSRIVDFQSPVAGVKTFLVVPKRGSVEVLDFEVLRTGAGDGRAAIAHFIGWATEAGYRFVRADAVKASIPFWTAMGFRPTGKKDGQLTVMRLHL